MNGRAPVSDPRPAASRLSLSLWERAILPPREGGPVAAIGVRKDARLTTGYGGG
ncbi:hypothetical protein DFR50_12492 [Roseiarcus fermentans]|uniref:Uncharacterized protein n=1 Tax=Roseiarcus fermentans TaxID=1473586 RepID=A0A366F4S0_9HYPH|nr:hypothetical protein DFR50_12492 [Roseiarcus fermentans]